MNWKTMCGSLLVLASIVQPVRADEGYEPNYSASPSARSSQSVVRATPTPRPAACEVTVVKGANSLAPNNVTFETKTAVSGITVDQILYDYGDGVTAASDPRATHRYGQAGTYTVTARPMSKGKETAVSCTTSVTLKAPPFVPRKTECTSVSIQGGTLLNADEATVVTVKGYDSKEKIQNYRLKLGEQQWDNSTGIFDVTTPSVGSYVVQGYVQDAAGNWLGGENACRQELRVRTTEITQQPATGPANWYWIGLASLLIVWLGVELWYQTNHQRGL